MLWGIPISYKGFPYNIGDSHVIWAFPTAGNNGNNGNNGNKGEKKTFFIKLNQIK